LPVVDPGSASTYSFPGVSEGETESDSPDPTRQRPFAAKALSSLDGSNEGFLQNVVSGLLIAGDRRQRIPKPEVFRAVEILELGESGIHVS